MQICIKDAWIHVPIEKNTLFIWDAMAQQDFDNLKNTIMHSPIFHPYCYSKDYMLYLAASTTTIGMVLV